MDCGKKVIRQDLRGKGVTITKEPFDVGGGIDKIIVNMAATNSNLNITYSSEKH